MKRRRPPPPTDLPPPLTPGRLWLFRLVSAVVVPLLLLALLEGALRLLGVGFDPGFTRPCQVGGRPAACENPDFSRRFFPPGVGRSPSSFAVPAVKAARTYRIFVLGESAAQGDPEPAFAFSRFLEVMLRRRLPGVRFEVVNAGVVAINSHALLPIARDLARLQPDLFVVYAGHNEVVGPFGSGTVLTARSGGLAAVRTSLALRTTRVGQLLGAALERGRPETTGGWRGMEMFLGQQVRSDDPSLESVYRNFEANLRDLVAAARASGAPVLLSTVGTRLVGCGPFASAHRLGLAAEALAAWEARVAAGDAHEQAGRLVEARAEYLAAEGIDRHHAELQYRLGRVALAGGATAEARERLTRARDLDTLRFRADSRMDAIIRGVAARAGAGVELVDGAAALSAASPDGLTDGRLFYEHVHLSPEGNHVLASALLPAVLEALPAELKAGATGDGPLPFDEAAELLALTGFDRYRVAKAVLGRLQRPPFTAQLDHDRNLRELTAERDRGGAEPYQETEAHYRATLARAADDPWLHYDLGLLLDTRDVHLARRGQPDPGRAIPEFQRALELLPRWPEPRIRLAETYLRLGRTPEAMAECRRLIDERPHYGQAHLSLAWAMARAGWTEDAIAGFQRAAREDPALTAEAMDAVRQLEGKR